MRILFTFIGGVGHFHPLVPIARAAQAAGHEVAVACAAGLVGPVESAGFAAMPTSEPRPVPASTGSARDLTPLAPTDAGAAEIEFAENFADKGARRHATAIQRWIREWQPDVVVRDEADLGSAIAAEVLGVPVASVVVLAAGMLIRPELVGPPLAAVRAEHSLPPDPDLAMLTRGLVLSPVPPSFPDPASPLPTTGLTHHFRTPVAPRVERLPGRQRVYATLGTEFGTTSGDLYERMLTGLGTLDADVLLTVGSRIDPAELGPAPPGVRVERFVPQDEVLSSVDVVVSHGGSGSLLAALAHGLPSVLLPLGADQPHNATRAEALGLATVLDAASATADDLARAVGEALHDVEMKARAQAIAVETAALPDVTTTVTALEHLSRTEG
ncbi:glycosyltransferase [Nocardioides sp. GXZ039]|uniref:glycosyltransferase n=1 Tax=Nocardioides sp. GXZ039 TaxID=3136018 RepID=UPI0030F37EB8